MNLKRILLFTLLLLSGALQASQAATTTTSSVAPKNRTGMVMTVHNVGQGNGIVINVPGHPTFVCDAGSSSRPTDLATRTKKSQEEVGQEMQENISENGDDVSCVISHPDKDHGNLVPQALAKSTKVKSLVGGSKKEYRNNKDLKSALKILEEKGNCKDVASCKTAKDLQNQLPSYVTVLAGNAQATDKNDESLVLRAQHEDFSVILPGDATGAVVDNLDKSKLKASVLIASHHGAQLNDTNSEKFIAKVDPNAAIISANTMGGYLHPHQEAVSRLVEHFNKKPETADDQFHDVSYGALPDTKINVTNESGTYVTYLELDKSIKRRKALVAATNMSIYSTNNSGDITVEQTVDENGKSTFTVTEQYGSRRTLRSCMIQGIETYLPWIQRIFLSDSGFTDKKIMKISTLPERLRLLDVTDNKLTKEGIEHLLTIIRSSQCVCNPELMCRTENQKPPIISDQITLRTSPALKALRAGFSIDRISKPVSRELTHIVLLPKID